MSVLVLNAGVLTPGAFESKSAKSQQDMLDTNVYHVVMMAKLLLPQLVARKRRTALIVNSSAAHMKWFPGALVYSATKAFVSNFTEGLAMEMVDTNVDV